MKITCICINSSDHPLFSAGNAYEAELYKVGNNGIHLTNDNGTKWGHAYSQTSDGKLSVMTARGILHFINENMISDKDLFHLKMSGRLPS